MKKFINSIVIISLSIIFAFTTNIYAAALDTLTVDVDKTTVEPGEEVKVTVNFGQELGAYTFNFAYDNNIFEYVSVDGGTANDTSDKVIVTYYDTTGGTNPRSNMTITFKAKSDLTTSNPTQFLVTAEGLANADASVTYDDITTPIVKDVTVEPKEEIKDDEEVKDEEVKDEEVKDEEVKDEEVKDETNLVEKEEPKELPKTGLNIYVPIALILIALAGSYIYYIKRK